MLCVPLEADQRPDCTGPIAVAGVLCVYKGNAGESFYAQDCTLLSRVGAFIGGCPCPLFTEFDFEYFSTVKWHCCPSF